MSIVKRRWFKALIILGVLAAGVFGGGILYFRWKFPYGPSHCCDKCLMFALDQYAEDHGGNYPAGEASPEASLSLLYPRYEPTGEILRGKTVPLEVVQPILERGGRLGPDTCGWHYVEGLRLDDDPRLALCWDKARLGHNGQRTADGGTAVLFVKLGYEYIPGSKWNEFLAEQEKLLAEHNEKKLARPNP
ncbi:MAG TPA: hypothetical protein DD670_09770 [Planctomycetaceae bacterium]|nr:hypothetical protein [Planctomycetaceae bacterium]